MSWNFLANIFSSALSKAKDLDEAFAGKGKGCGLLKVLLIIIFCLLLPIVLLILLYKWVSSLIENSTQTNTSQKTKSSTTALPTQQTPQGSNATVPEAENITEQDLKETPELVWLIEEWLYKNDLAVLFGPPKGGKSTLAMQIAKYLAEGCVTDVFPVGENGNKQIVLYYHLEMKADEVKHDYPDLLESPNIDYFIKPPGINTPKKLVEDIRKQILRRRRNSVTVIVDTISYLGEAKSDKDLLTLLDELKQEVMKAHKVSLTVLLLNHTDDEKYKDYKILEPDVMRGAQKLSRDANVVFCMNNTAEGKDVKYIKMNLRRSAEKKSKCIVVRSYETPTGRRSFKYLREDEEMNLLPGKPDYTKKRADKKGTGSEKKREPNLRLSPEQRQLIVELYHSCGDNLNATARAVCASEDELLCEIKNFNPTQVSRIVNEPGK